MGREGVWMSGGEGGELVRRLARLEGGVRREQRSNFIEVGKLLSEILDNQLFVAKGYRSFVKYVDDDRGLKFTGKHAVRLVRTYRFIQSLPQELSLPTSERQVRPLIKLGFDEARLVWMEAQRIGARDGKSVTGELVSEIVSQLEKSRSGSVSRTRHNTLSRVESSAYPATLLTSSPAASLERSVSPCSSFQTGLDASQLSADFEHLRAKIKVLPAGDKEQLLLRHRKRAVPNGEQRNLYSRDGPWGERWKRSLDTELQTLTTEDPAASHTGERSRKRSKDEMWSGSEAGDMTHGSHTPEESHSSHAEGLKDFSCKRKRSGSRRPRVDMSLFTLSKAQSGNSFSKIGERKEHRIQTDEDDNNNKADCRGLGLLWSAAEIVSN